MLNFKVTKANLERTLNMSCFVKKKYFLISSKRAVLYFSDGLTDTLLLDEYVIRPLCDKELGGKPTYLYLKSMLPHIDMLSEKDMDKAILNVFDGDALLFIDGMNEFLIISSKKWDKRAIMEPPTSVVLKGPREGFTEDLVQNISLLKRKLKSPLLKLDFLKAGKVSRTMIAIVYLEGIAKPSVIKSITDKINSICIDGILDSSYLRQYLSPRKFSFFRQVGDTEKPDILASKLLEGRVGIIVDGSPIVLTLPFLLIEDYQASEDYYAVPHYNIFLRILRLISMLFGVFMPGFYVSAQIFHIQFLPLPFLQNIASGTKNIPFSPPLEMLVTLLIFEILNEASIRMPRYVGTAMSIVGAIVLGDTAVRANLLSTPTILITALSGIAVYAIPNQRNTLSIIRILFLLASGSFGIIGLLSASAVISLYLVSLESFGIPYLSPYAPRNSEDLKDGFLKSPQVISNYRPSTLSGHNKRRLLWKD